MVSTKLAGSAGRPPPGAKSSASMAVDVAGDGLSPTAVLGTGAGAIPDKADWILP